MADCWVNALRVVLSSGWTPEFKQEVGEMVLSALKAKWVENQNQPDADMEKMTFEEFFKYMDKDNSRVHATITVSSS